MEIRYEVAKEKDVTDVFNLFRDLKTEEAQVGFNHVKDENEINEWIFDPNVIITIAKDQKTGKIIGVFRGKRGNTYKHHSAFITAAIDRDYRGHRIAKNLTLYSLEVLKNEGVIIARTYVYSDNKASLNTLLSCGFTIGGSVVMHHYSEKQQRFVDDVILHKIL